MNIVIGDGRWNNLVAAWKIYESLGYTFRRRKVDLCDWTLLSNMYWNAHWKNTLFKAFEYIVCCARVSYRRKCGYYEAVSQYLLSHFRRLREDHNVF